MDIEKEREAFEAVMNTYHCIYNADLNYYFSGSKFVGNKAEMEVNAGWKAWQAAKAQAVPEWISVKNSLPPENTLVLGMSQTPCNIFNIYNVMALDEFQESDITHWMPLPDAPQEPTND